TDAWRNSLDHYQEFVIIVALDLKIEVGKNAHFLNRKESFMSLNLSHKPLKLSRYLILALN
ncbi:hypothetical protein, partial [Lacticaseibacillus paracasei]|uniref:hypothetical protein n=2 Tax=Lacticaseibacillus paracasei TaxID=1597 RepID=UPI001C7DD967